MLDEDYENVSRSNRVRSGDFALGLSAAGWTVALPLEWSKAADAPAVNHKCLVRCLLLIQDRLYESLNFLDFKKMFNISVQSLHHAFLAHWGCTPQQVFVNARINRAKQLMLEPPQPQNSG